MSIVDEIRRRIDPGCPIPKPRAKGNTVKGWGTRRGEAALIYRIPRKDGDGFNEKGVTESEWEAAFNQLQEEGVFTRAWFEENLRACAAEGGCSFTTIGGIFKLLGLAEHSSGRYTRVRREPARGQAAAHLHSCHRRGEHRQGCLPRPIATSG